MGTGIKITPEPVAPLYPSQSLVACAKQKVIELAGERLGKKSTFEQFRAC